jgi:hypothetical protein
MFHTWFAAGTKWEKVQAGMPGPPPGYVVGGPNLYYDYAPPLGQPALKSYLQFGDGWPANSWAVTEPSTLYQANYIRSLA